MARSIGDRQADEIAIMAAVAFCRLRLTRLDADVVLGGGILHNDDPAFFDQIEHGSRPWRRARGCRRPESASPRRLEEGGIRVAGIVLEHVTKVFGSYVVAVNDLSLEIADGEFMVLVGPSGCGKSTILRLLAGLEEVTAGEIYIDGRRVTDLPPKSRDVAMVFQNYALYPHMTVEQNLGFALKLRRMSKEEIRRRVLEIAWMLDLENLLKRKPAALSGGQQQRVAMGRAMVREPEAFLMDEPLSNLDAKLRIQMRTELARLHDRLGTTTVYVTHDQVEAMTLGGRVAVMRDGVLQQVDTPQNLYKRPANLFVAAFIGMPPMNLVEARVGDGTLYFGGFQLPIPEGAQLEAYEGGTVILGIRPSDLEDADVRRDESLPTIEVTAQVTEELGSEVNIFFTVDEPPVSTEGTMAPAAVPSEEAPIPLIAGRERSIFCARVGARTRGCPGSRVRLSVDPHRFHFFDPLTGIAVGARSEVGSTA